MTEEYLPKHIMDHYRNPKNAGRIEGADIQAEEYSSHCGDETKIHIKLEEDKISDFKHETIGCTLCVAGASMLSEEILGKDAKEISNLDETEFLKKFETEISDSRKECALLALKALKNNLKN